MEKAICCAKKALLFPEAGTTSEISMMSNNCTKKRDLQHGRCIYSQYAVNHTPLVTKSLIWGHVGK